MRKRFLTLSVVIICCCIVMAAAPPAAAQGAYEKGKSLFHAGKYQKAYEKFQAAFEAGPADPNVNFYLGRAAFETGKYEQAIMAFERVLIADPGANRARLEIARAYHELGSSNIARKYCYAVLRTDPPPNVRQNIEKFLAYMQKSQQRHFFSGSLSAGYGYNDNVYSSPFSRRIDTVLGDVILTGETAEETDDTVYNATLEMKHAYRLPFSDAFWNTSVTTYHAGYREAGILDTLYLAGKSGPELVLGRYSLGASVLADHVALDSETYQNSLGANIAFGYLAASFLKLQTELVYENKNFANRDRDAHKVGASAEAAFYFSPYSFNTGAGIERWNAETEAYSFDRYSATFEAQRRLPYDMRIYANYEFRLSDYDGSLAVFGEDRRDAVHYAGAGVEKIVWRQPKTRRRLVAGLNYLHTVSDSTIDIYEYSKNEVFGALSYQF